MPIDRLSREARREIELAQRRANEIAYAIERTRAKGRHDLSKVQSVDQRMRLECAVGFSQLRTCRRTRPGSYVPRTRHRVTGCRRVRREGRSAATPLSSVMNSHPSSRIRLSCYRLAAGRSPTGTMMCAYGVPFHMT